MTKELQPLDAAHAAASEEMEAAADVAAPESTTAPERTTTTVTIFKPTPHTSVGISMIISKGITLIIKVTPGGLTSNTHLQVGMQIVSIIDMFIRNARHARELIQTSRIEVSITCFTRNMFYKEYVCGISRNDRQRTINDGRAGLLCSIAEYIGVSSWGNMMYSVDDR